MAEADIAFAAAAGAAGLALAVSAWTWRLKRAVTLRDGRLEQERIRLTTDLARAVAGQSAFGDIRIGLMAGDPPVVLGESRAIAAAHDALSGGDIAIVDGGEDARPEALVAAVLSRFADRIETLRQTGTPFLCRGESAGAGSSAGMGDRPDDWAIEGNAFGGEIWLRLFRDRDGPVVAIPARPDAGLGAGVIADASPAPAWVIDSAGKLIWANRAWLAEVRCDSLDEAFASGASFDRGADQLAAEAGRLGTRQEGFRWTAADGRRRAWKIQAEPLAGAGGPVMLFALDVTEAEETRDTLRRHVEAHDETLNHLADAVAIFGPSRRLAFHNTAFQTLFNIDPAWLDERPTHAELLDRLRQRRMLPEVIDYAGWKANELEFYGAAEAAPDDSWSLPDGRTLRVVRQPHPLGGILLLFSDITGELSLRSRFNAQLQVQTATLDKLNDAVAVFGSDGRLRLHNEAFEQFWALSGEQLEAAGEFDAVAELCKTALPDVALWLGLKARVADPDPESRVAVSGEGRTTDGRVAAWQTRPLPDGATLVAFSDVTARRDLEQALAQREAALSESQALKREFVGSVSYELRTPLTTIVGYSELLESMEDLPERSRQHAGAIRIAAGQLAHSIDDVLDMAQIDAGEMELSLGDVTVRDLFATAVGIHRPRIEGRGATLKAVAAANLPAIRGDSRRLAQALDHLLDNAGRSVSEGGVVSLRAEANASEIRIRVEDTGRGIPYHLQAHVFDRFVKRERGGPGVGLALVKALVELHGGWAEVESEPGKGAAFILHLPLEMAGATAETEPELSVAVGG